MPMSPGAGWPLAFDVAQRPHRPGAGVRRCGYPPRAAAEPSTAPPAVASMRTLEVGTVSRPHCFTQVRQAFQSRGSSGFRNQWDTFLSCGSERSSSSRSAGRDAERAEGVLEQQGGLGLEVRQLQVEEGGASHQGGEEHGRLVLEEVVAGRGQVVPGAEPEREQPVTQRAEPRIRRVSGAGVTGGSFSGREQEADRLRGLVRVRGEAGRGLAPAAQQQLLEALEQRHLVRLGGDVLGLERGQPARDEATALGRQQAEAGAQAQAATSETSSSMPTGRSRQTVAPGLTPCRAHSVARREARSCSWR